MSAERENQTPLFDRFSFQVLQRRNGQSPAATAPALLPGVEPMPMGVVEEKERKDGKRRTGCTGSAQPAQRRQRLSQSRCFNCGEPAQGRGRVCVSAGAGFACALAECRRV